MKITYNSLQKYNPNINNKKQNYPVETQQKAATFDNLPTTQESIYSPNFTGFFGLFSSNKKSTQMTNNDGNVQILSPRQVKKRHYNATSEVYKLLGKESTPANMQRLDELLNSKYLDYSKRIDGTTLAKKVISHSDTKNNELYNRFLLVSLAKTMSFENLEKCDIEDLYWYNDALVNLFKNYKNVDENSEDAKLYQKMLLRLKNHGLKCDDFPAFFADCMVNNKPKMCKFLQKNFDVTPNSNICVLDLYSDALAVLGKCLPSGSAINVPLKDSYKKGQLIIYSRKVSHCEKTPFRDYVDSKRMYMTLQELFKITPNPNPKCFDIPELLYSQIDKRVENTSYYASSKYCWAVNDMIDSHWQNSEEGSLYNNFEVLEGLAAKLNKDGRDYVDVITAQAPVLLKGDSKLPAALKRLKQLKADYSPENKERYELVKNLSVKIGKVNRYNEDKINAKLAEIDNIPWNTGLASEFKEYENVDSLDEMPLVQKRELMRKLIRQKSQLTSCTVGDLKVNFLPRDNTEYKALMAKLSKSMGIDVKPLSKTKIAEFNSMLDKISEPNSEFMQIDFENKVKRLKLDYSLEDFKKDIWFETKDLSAVERGKVLDFYGFELKNDYGKLTLNGFPNLQNSEAKVLSKYDDKILEKIKDCEPLVKDFVENNEVTIKNAPEASKDLTEIFNTFPEILTTVGKLQNQTHDFTLDIHTIKVLQNLFKSKDYQNLPEKSQQQIRLAALLHDIDKSEGVVDKYHPQNSAFDAYYLLKKLDLSENDRLKIYQIISEHTWLANLKNTDDDVVKLRKKLAFNFRENDTFKLATILTEADLKAVKKNEAMYVAHCNDLNKESQEITPYVKEIQKNAIYLPQTNLPKVGEINKNSNFVTELDADGIKNTVIHLKQGIDLKEVGFKNAQKPDDLNLLVHALDSEDSATMMQVLGLLSSDALLSSSYINYFKKNWRVFRKQGFVLKVPDSNIHAGYYRDFGSGLKKNKSELIDRYLFDNNKYRTYFAEQLKSELNLSDKEYIKLYNQIENRSIEELDENFPQVAKAYRSIFDKMDIKKRSMGRNYNEILVSNPAITGIFCYDKTPEKIPDYLRKYAQDNDIPILSFED